MRRLAPAVVLVVLALTACTTTTTSGNGTTSDTGSQIPVDLLHDTNAANKAMLAIEKKVGTSPARVSEILVYPDYMIVDAQDPNALDHINRYTWRGGTVDPSEPVHLSGPQDAVDASLFSTSAVNLEQLPRIVLDAEQTLQRAKPVRIEQARGSYIDIQRSTSSELDGRITIHISVEGPRRSGTVETGSNGEILSTNVS
jgi:hypothetical protein